MVQVAGILSLSAGLLLLLHGIALPGVSEAKTPRTHTGLQKGLRSTGHQRPSYQKPAAQANPGSVHHNQMHDQMHNGAHFASALVVLPSVQADDGIALNLATCHRVHGRPLLLCPLPE